MLREILEALLPLLIDLLALLLSLAIGWLSVQAHRYLGVQVEARHREALHSAIMTGVRRSLTGNLPREQILQEALDYARASVPDAVRALTRPEGVLRELSEAKLKELLDTRGQPPQTLE